MSYSRNVRRDQDLQQKINSQPTAGKCPIFRLRTWCPLPGVEVQILSRALYPIRTYDDISRESFFRVSQKRANQLANPAKKWSDTTGTPVWPAQEWRPRRFHVIPFRSGSECTGVYARPSCAFPEQKRRLRNMRFPPYYSPFAQALRVDHALICVVCVIVAA